MKRKRIGFTMVEIALFLAITGLLFVGIIAGTNNSIAKQRFTDSVQNFTELIRSVYSEVSNPQSVGDGRAEIAIYGKLISFGQTTGLDGTKIDELDQRVFVYDVVGSADAGRAGSGTVADVLGRLGAGVAVVAERNASGEITRMDPAGEVRSYIPRWGASIETTEMNKTKGNLYKGSILIIRHPGSGTINTLISNRTIEVNATLKTANTSKNKSDFDKVEALLSSSVLNSFETRQEDFCINPRGAEVESSNRRDVRIVKNARNASGVEVVDLDLDEIVDGVQIGNKCRFSN